MTIEQFGFIYKLRYIRVHDAHELKILLASNVRLSCKQTVKGEYNFDFTSTAYRQFFYDASHIGNDSLEVISELLDSN